jgi:hypothetical protein
VVRGLRVPVNLTSRESLRIFGLADIWATRTGQDVRLVSANDHVHSRRSAHYAGLALDFQSSDPEGLATAFRLAGYRVLWKVPGHYGHVHVEQDGSSDTPFDQRPSIQTPDRVPTPRPRPGVPVGG